MRREATAQDFFDLICSRQSIAPKRLIEPGPGPGPGILEAIVRAACSVPDHGALHPWSGEKTLDPLVRDVLLLGFIATIHPSHSPPKRRRAVEEYFSTWTGPSWQVTSQP